ncbi:MAG TPA: hypothetical protein VFQ88_08990 [Nevskiaceae bacterium]|nr:hypothetical protein [Nevskiaceae bacterium]
MPTTLKTPPPEESRLREIGRQLILPVLLIIACVAGGLAGAWGLPRLVVLTAPHAPTWAVYGAAIPGIFIGGIVGLAIIEFASRGLSRLLYGDRTAR